MPYAYVGKTVDTKLTETLLKVFYKSEEIALHKRINEKGEFSTINSHYPDFKIFDLSEHYRAYKEKMAIIGPNTLKFFEKTVSRQPKYWTRALAFEFAEYQAVKRICKNSAYALPLEEAFL